MRRTSWSTPAAGCSAACPAAVRVVNHDSQTVQIDLTKQQIKDAPEFDHSTGYGPYRDVATQYYGPMM
jgi:hypothetical protein